jgi:hypothetical protein
MKYLINIGLSALVSITSIAHAAEVISSTETHSNSPHIRTLAASCAACHGSNGNALQGNAVLAGMDGNYFTTQMLIGMPKASIWTKLIYSQPIFHSKSAQPAKPQKHKH